MQVIVDAYRSLQIKTIFMIQPIFAENILSVLAFLSVATKTIKGLEEGV